MYNPRKLQRINRILSRVGNVSPHNVMFERLYRMCNRQIPMNKATFVSILKKKRIYHQVKNIRKGQAI